MEDAEKRVKTPEKILNDPIIEVSTFDKLDSELVYKMLALRFNVFVIEQQSIYPEFDGHDFAATHFIIRDEDAPVAYARVYQDDGHTAHLGRIVVDKDYRGQELGRKIVDRAITEVKSNMKQVDTIVMGAQTYLRKFYESFGFVPTSEPYDDAGVEHIDMSLKIDRSLNS